MRSRSSSAAARAAKISKDQQLLRHSRHRLAVEDAEVTEVTAIGADERHSEIALDRHFG